MSAHALTSAPPIVGAPAYAGARPPSSLRTGARWTALELLEDGGILLGTAFLLPFVVIAAALPLVGVVQLVSWLARSW